LKTTTIWGHQSLEKSPKEILVRNNCFLTMLSESEIKFLHDAEKLTFTEQYENLYQERYQ